MAIVTLLTDSGESDHYVAAIRARILSLHTAVQLVDLTHAVRPGDIAHGAFVLRSVFRDFPKGTVHLVGVNATGGRDDAYIALQLEDHFFVGCDNGLFGLISDQEATQVVKLPDADRPTTFPERDIFAPAAARLAAGDSLAALGETWPSFKRMTDRQVKATRKQITGQVVHVDEHGNLITNIPREAFDILSRGKTYTIQFGGEKFRRIHTQYHQAEEGECFILFNSLNVLEIGIFKGNASELLGLGYDSVVHVHFDE